MRKHAEVEAMYLSKPAARVGGRDYKKRNNIM